MTQLNKAFRPEIDGLRAISVLVILLFHGGFEWASGGFIGVDVFFVISGYLITRNICFDINSGRFSFNQFYIKRIKRLFPALFFTLAVVLVMGFVLFSPMDYERLGQSLQYAVVSLSNFFFWSEANYFDASSELKPLLHTWSLAVEEQYYLIWPTLLFGLSLIKKRGVLLIFLSLAIITSLSLNHFYLKNHAVTVFYMLPFRVFEFALGAMCVSFYEKGISNRVVNEVLTLVGLGLIIWSVLTFNESTLFPGYSALVPCLGAALVIVSQQSTVGKIFLSNWTMLKIGVTSYSIYLIHWPLLVFYKYWKFTPITQIESIILLLISLLLGWFMWRFIEQPFRKYSPDLNAKSFWLKFLFFVALIFSLGFLTHQNKGWPERYPSEYFMTNEEIKENRDRYWSYFAEENDAIEKQAGFKNVVVMGNSHAVDLVYAMRENDAKLNVTFFNSWFLCYNFGTALEEKDEQSCSQRLNRHLKNKAWKTADVIYLHDHWPKLDLPDLKKRLLQIREITSAPIYVFGPKMSYYKRVPDIILSHMRMSSINEYAKEFSHKLYLKNLNAVVKDLIADSEIPELYYVDILSVQCGSEIDQCEVISPKDGNFLYFDYSHFTLQGAREFGEKLKTVRPDLFE